MPIITPFAPETLVNTSTNGFQTMVVSTALANGQYVLVWVDSLTSATLNGTTAATADIKARIFNADGTPAGGEILVNTITTAGQILPSVTTLSDGNFLVAWQDGAGTVIGGAGFPPSAIRAQEFTASGAPVGGEFQIGPAGTEAFFPSVSALAGGGFVAVWQAGANGAYVAQRFDSSNAAVGSQIVVDNTATQIFGRAMVTTLTDGNFVIATAGANGEVTARIYTAAGTQVGSDIGLLFPQVPQISSRINALVALTDGSFAVMTQRISNFGPGVGQQANQLAIFHVEPSQLGNPNYQIGQVDLVDQPSLATINGSLVALPGGRAAASWTNNNVAGTTSYAGPQTMPDGSGTSINFAAFSADGNLIQPLGASGFVNSVTTGDQLAATMVAGANGNFVLAWVDGSNLLGDASGYGIVQRQFGYDPTNRAPIAANGVVRESGIVAGQAFVPEDWSGQEGNYDFLEDFYQSGTPNRPYDPDGDALVLTGFGNVTNGTVTQLPNGSLQFTVANTAAPLTMSYTIADGQGGSATGTYTLVNPDDAVTVRGLTPTLIPVLANDLLQPNEVGGGLATLVGPSVGTLSLTFIGGVTPAYSYTNTYSATTGYSVLPVGQTQVLNLVYQYSPLAGQGDPYAANLTITLQGWAQLGNANAEYLVGGALSDHLLGGTGAANTLQGGAGDDWYTVAASGDSVFEFADEGTDQVFTALGSFVLPANVEFLTYTGTGNFVGIGNSLNNGIAGTSGNDELYGGAGNDTLVGQSGINTLVGGTGDDIYLLGSAADTVLELAGEGTDRVQVAGNYVLGDTLENLTLTGSGAFVGIGNAGDNAIVGNGGNNQLSGGGGNDTLTGGAGSNTLIGGTGDDIYRVSTTTDSVIELAGEGIDTVQLSAASHTLSANVENLVATGSGARTVLGNALANNITGGALGDFLSGLDGDDILTGGAGSDTLVGGNGADQFRYIGGDGVDTVSGFTSGTDKFALLGTAFTQTGTVQFVQGAGAVANTANSTFLYDSSTGIVSYDADGNGAGAAVALASIGAGLTLAAGDFTFY